MEKIKSFQVDHTRFGVGMYLSRTDCGVVTYDLRMVRPNGGVYLSASSAHTIEHLFATYARSSPWGAQVIYVGPMGCRTGFYLLTSGLAHEQAIELARQSLAFVSGYEGEVPGCSEVECGNFREHDLDAARKDVRPLLDKLAGYTPEMLNYQRHMK
jgi:S-ribosylhomocysteine lyase